MSRLLVGLCVVGLVSFVACDNTMTGTDAGTDAGSSGGGTGGTGGTGGGTAGTGGGTAGTGGGTAGTGGGAAVDLTTVAKITAFLEGKTLTMEGANIPTSPNGYNENVNFGAATQCYKKTVITVASGNFTVNSQLGTLRGADGGAAPAVGMVGVCDRTVSTANFGPSTTTTLLIENVQGNATCFDVTATYNGYGQVGRASITENGTKMTMELFFAGQPANHRCADGAVGATGVTLTTTAGTFPFTGNAKQVYVVTQ